MATERDITRAIKSLSKPKKARTRTKQASYREAIQWIGRNDDTTDLFNEEPSPSVTMSMVADLFDRPIEKVMDDVTRYLDITLGQGEE